MIYKYMLQRKFEGEIFLEKQKEDKQKTTPLWCVYKVLCTCCIFCWFYYHSFICLYLIMDVLKYFFLFFNLIHVLFKIYFFKDQLSEIMHQFSTWFHIIFFPESCDWFTLHKVVEFCINLPYFVYHKNMWCFYNSII